MNDGELLTLTEARHVHAHVLALALGPFWVVDEHLNATDEEVPGSFRCREIQPFPGGMVPPSWVEVDAAMREWLRSVGIISDAENQVETIAVAHAAFERIDPFLDGNGRAGRLLPNLVLGRLGYPPAIIYTRDRNRQGRFFRSGH